MTLYHKFKSVALQGPREHHLTSSSPYLWWRSTDADSWISRQILVIPRGGVEEL